MKILIIGALLLASCAPQKILTESDTRVEQEVKTDVTTSVVSKEWLDKYLSERAFELTFRDVLFERVEYDTTLPVDSTTGLSPVKAVTKITDKSRSKSGAVKESVENHVVDVDSMVADKSVVSTDLRQSVVVKEKKGVAVVWGWLIAIIIAAAIAIGVYVTKKYF